MTNKPWIGAILALAIVPVSLGAQAPPPAPAQARQSLTGVLTAAGDPSDQVELTIVLSAQNRPIFQYQSSSSGLREVELTEVGQVVQWVPPGGGVRTVEVAALQATNARVQWVIATSFEKSGAVLTQSFGKETITLTAATGGYDAEVQIISATRLSDLDLSVGGNPDVTVYRGVLRP